jgi:MYXO-CTERM domain-containing protein
VVAAAAAVWLMVLAPAEAFGVAIDCSLLRAQIYDGIPGSGVLIGASTGGCPTQAGAAASDIDANASGTITFSENVLSHLHDVDLKASATTRVVVSEAFVSFLAPAQAPLLLIEPNFLIQGSTYSAVLQLETAGERLTYFTGVPVLAGETTVQADSDGVIPTGAVFLQAGERYTLYSRVSTFGDFDQSNVVTLGFAVVPEPHPGLLVLVGLGAIGAWRRGCSGTS